MDQVWDQVANMVKSQAWVKVNSADQEWVKVNLVDLEWVKANLADLVDNLAKNLEWDLEVNLVNSQWAQEEDSDKNQAWAKENSVAQEWDQVANMVKSQEWAKVSSADQAWAKVRWVVQAWAKANLADLVARDLA